MFSMSWFVGASQRLKFVFFFVIFGKKLTHSTVKLNRMTMPAKMIREKVILITISSEGQIFRFISTFYMFS